MYVYMYGNVHIYDSYLISGQSRDMATPHIGSP